MNIYDALIKLKEHGGQINRDDIGIYQWEGESWEALKKCRSTLTIEDLSADDWTHKGKP